jgi:casein kinase II subunit alpha
MARVYAEVNATLGESWYDYGELFDSRSILLAKGSMAHLDNFRIDWSRSERYEIVRRMGGGKYSEVSDGMCVMCSLHAHLVRAGFRRHRYV